MLLLGLQVFQLYVSRILWDLKCLMWDVKTERFAEQKRLRTNEFGSCIEFTTMQHISDRFGRIKLKGGKHPTGKTYFCFSKNYFMVLQLSSFLGLRIWVAQMVHFLLLLPCFISENINCNNICSIKIHHSQLRGHLLKISHLITN